jgi:SAM-dependent methyltransferase
MQNADAESTVRKIRDEYARVAERGGLETSCCTNDPCSENFGYDKDEVSAIPSGADMGLGCGAPIPALELQPGETVLDRKNARKGNYSNVEFRQGRLESLPVDDGSVDAVTSNCVINLVPDKKAVYTEIARVLRPGGRVVVSDIVLEKPLPDALLREMDLGNCIVTATQRTEYLAIVRSAGLAEPELLKDVDYLEAAGWTDSSRMNEESRALLERAGVSYDEIRGAVHSITLRSVKQP